MLPQACLNVLTRNSWSHLWYLYALIGLYLVLPVINAFFNKSGRKTCIIFASLLFIFTFLIPVVNRLFDINIAFEMPIVSYALFYFVAGKLIYTSNNKLLNKKWLFGCVLAFLLLLLLIINFYGGSKYLEYNSPIIAGISACVFLLLRGIKVNVSKRMWEVDRLCFGVHLIHPLFINFLYKFIKVTPLNFRNAYMAGVILMWIGFAIVAFIASYIMNLIKPLKKYVL